MSRGPGARTAALAIALMVAGGAVWATGVVAVGRYSEDLCLGDLEARTGYDSYQAEVSLWPPSFECRLDGSDVEPVAVQHRLVAFARFVAVAVVPLIFLVAVILVLAHRSRRRN